MTPALAHTHLERVHQDLQLGRHSDEAMLEASHCRRFTYKERKVEHRGPERPISICWARRPGAIDDNTVPARPPTTAHSSREQ